VVLDVGVGGGGSSLGLAKKVELIIGVDRLPTMLDLFEASARAAGVAARSVLGTWPAVADQVEVVDVAVSHHAVYGITELEEFITALTEHARHPVVLELSTDFPQAGCDRSGRRSTELIVRTTAPQKRSRPCWSPWVWASSAWRQSSLLESPTSSRNQWPSLGGASTSARSATRRSPSSYGRSLRRSTRSSPCGGRVRP